MCGTKIIFLNVAACNFPLSSLHHHSIIWHKGFNQRFTCWIYLLYQCRAAPKSFYSSDTHLPFKSRQLPLMSKYVGHMVSCYAIFVGSVKSLIQADGCLIRVPDHQPGFLSCNVDGTSKSTCILNQHCVVANDFIHPPPGLFFFMDADCCFDFVSI